MCLTIKKLCHKNGRIWIRISLVRYQVDWETERKEKGSFADPWHFGTDPDPGIHTSDQWILLFSSVTFKMATKKWVKNNFFANYFLKLAGSGTGTGSVPPKHTDPTDPDPQHWKEVEETIISRDKQSRRKKAEELKIKGRPVCVPCLQQASRKSVTGESSA
jgi:hypothetical protein